MPRRRRSLQGLSALTLTAAALLTGALLGGVAGLAGHTFELIGFYDLTAGLVGGFLLVALAHRLAERRLAVHLAAAALLAAGWLTAWLATDAWALRAVLIRHAADAGVLLADDAIVRGDDDPAGLVDDTLRAETGSAGVRGAARMRLQRGLRVFQITDHVRVVPMPSVWLALVLAARAALVALLVARSLEALRSEPLCPTCGRALVRDVAAYADETDLTALRALLEAGEPEDLRTWCTNHAAAGGPYVLLRDHCPDGHGSAPGYALWRQRGRRFATATAGPVAAVAMRTEPVESAVPAAKEG